MQRPRVPCLGFILLLSLAAQPAWGQRLSRADSASLVTAIVADLRASYKPAASGLFVHDSTGHSAGVLSGRIALQLVRRDTAFVHVKTTPRFGFSEPVINGDTASVSVTDRNCLDQGPMQYWGNRSTHRYSRAGSAWTPVPRRSVMHADGFNCPWT